MPSFASSPLRHFASSSFKKGIATFPQFLIENISPYLSSVLMGDHLVVLAKKSTI